jgi:uncharacterized SAM-binding protein YcdF (DUF218 family)
MHQLASSLLSFALSPLLWVGLLILAGILFHKRSRKKICWVLACLVVLLFGNGSFLNWYARQFQPPPLALAQGEVYSCGIIPGGFASPDVSGNGVFNSTADRFIQGLKLFKQGYITHLLISGGNGKKEMKTFREAAWVKQQFVIMGVPDSVIFIEDESHNTAENVANTKIILDDAHLSAPYLLISSAHHLPRASVLYKKAGISTVAYPCSYIAGRGISTFTDLLPSLGTLQTWNTYLKETAGYLWYR